MKNKKDQNDDFRATFNCFPFVKSNLQKSFTFLFQKRTRENKINCGIYFFSS